ILGGRRSTLFPPSKFSALALNDVLGPLQCFFSVDFSFTNNANVATTFKVYKAYLALIFGCSCGQQERTHHFFSMCGRKSVPGFPRESGTALRALALTNSLS